ncbi:TPA: hypothetical protein HA265_07680 [Candidatus Woesearchaeota archaeon]|nr:hypothetical protein [Candidatus Woesearchaeota archaeon]
MGTTRRFMDRAYDEEGRVPRPGSDYHEAVGAPRQLSPQMEAMRGVYEKIGMPWPFSPKDPSEIATFSPCVSPDQEAELERRLDSADVRGRLARARGRAPYGSDGCDHD